jgi:hypothetical protein
MENIFCLRKKSAKRKAKKIYNDLKRYDLDIWFDKETLLLG